MPIKYYTSDSNTGSESKSGSNSKSGDDDNNFPYADYNFNTTNDESSSKPSSKSSKSSSKSSIKSSSKSSSKSSKSSIKSSSKNSAVAAPGNTEYQNTGDVDHVRINVIGDGSCFYRALYTSAFMYPIERDIIKRQLLPEFASTNSLLLTVLQAFGYTKDTLLLEEVAVTFMRNELSKGILGTHADESINEICDTAVNSFYTLITGHLCTEFNSELSKESKLLLQIANNNNIVPSAYQAIIESMNRQIADFFTKTPVVQLTLKNFRDILAKTIVSKSTYASQFDVEIIKNLINRKNIVLKVASLNKFAPNQTFPIIENQMPVLMVDNIDESHYNSLIPKVEFDEFADTPFGGNRTLNSQVSRENNTTEEITNKKGKKKTVRKRGEPIIFSKRTFNYRKAKGLSGGRKTLKRRNRK